MSQIHILNHLTDQIVDTLENKPNAKLFWNDNHVSNLKNEENFDFHTLYDNSQHITSRNRVIIPDEDGFFLEFIIDETIKDKEQKEVYTTASYLDLRKQKVIEPTTLEGATVNTSTDFILSGTEWRRGTTEYAGVRSIKFENYSNPFKALKQIASTFELELRFRVEIQGNRITGRFVDLIKHQGEWRGKEVTVGKDLIGLKRREQADNIVSALLCLGPEREDGTRLVLTVEDEEARQRWSRTGQHMWDIYEPQSEDQDMTEERLSSLGETELKKRINSVVQYEADQASIEHIFGYEHEKVRLGDITRIKDTSYNPALYMEARVISVERSISDPSQKKYILGDFIEYDEEDLKADFRALQKIVAQKVSEQKLLDTTYTKVQIDDKDESVYQDGTIYTDQRSDQAEGNAKEHADTKASEAEQNAIQAAEQDAQNKVNEAKTALEADISAKADKLYVDAEIALKVAQDIYDAKVAELEGSIDSKVAETTFNTTITSINADIAEKAGLEYVDGQLQLKADDSRVDAINTTVSDLETTTSNLQQAVTDHANELQAHDGRITTVSTDLDTVEGTLNATITDLSNLDDTVNQQQTSINANAQAISLKASQDDLDTVSGDVSSLSAELNVQAGRIDLKAEQSALETLEGDVTTVSNNLSSLAVDVDGISTSVSSLSQTVDGHTTDISSLESEQIQQAGLIEARVTKTEYEADQDGVVTRFDNAESRITQTESDISQRVTLTTYESGMAGKENTVFKQTSAPSHANGRLWLNTSVTPNILYRSTGSAWVKATPTTASEVGAETPTGAQNKANTAENNAKGYTDNQISPINTRLSTAETVIDQNADEIQLRATKTEVNTLEGRVSTAESTLSVHADEIASKVSQVNHDSLTGRVSTAETNITQNANEIATKASQTDVDALGTRMTNAETTITQNSNDITLKATQSDLDTVEGRVTDAEAEIVINANEISQRVAKTTYDTKMSELDNSISNHATRLSTAETSIQQNADSITLKANSTDVYTKSQVDNNLGTKANQTDLNTTNSNVSALTTRVSSAESELTVQAGQISQRVTKTEFDNLQIGGRNLLKFKDITGHGSVWEDTKEIYEGAPVFKNKVSNPGSGNNFGFRRNGNETIVFKTQGSKHTISFNFKTIYFQHDRNLGGRVQVRYTDGETERFTFSGIPDLRGENEDWKSYQFTFEPNKNKITDRITEIFFWCDWAPENSEILYTLPKLEKGNKATDWTPAPEDVDSSINGLGTRLSTAEATITNHGNMIEQRVTTTTYNSGMAGKENTVFKQNSAPAHLNGRLWLNTSVTPNILYRSTGSAWVKATPTTASEVGAFSSSDGSNLAGRLSTAESTITQHSDAINLRVEKNNVISEINQTSESIRIAANRIHIDGNVTFSSGYNPKTANDTIDNNKVTWDRASNINSNGTFNTSKLSGTVAENQINSTSTGKWNTANADTTRWKMSGKTTINGGQIETDTITAVQISVTSLDAISANLGTVTAGTIQGVEIIGGSISSNTDINVTTDLYVGDNIYIGDSAQLGTKRLMFNEDSYFQAIDNDVFINALNGKLDIAANGRMNLLAANDTFELYTKQAVLQTTDDFVRIRRGSRPTTIYEVLGRSDTTEIYWNADQNNDYGMIYRVGGTIAARMYRTGAMDIEGDLTVKGTRAIVNQLGFSSGTISGTRNGDIWYGNGFAGVGWYFRKSGGWVREIAG
ncbi:phage tail spike protein [Alkalihalobacterium alkalinitrilicum]|uniref:phage tail spike protein n=1 Tax=Alkalihalobacterium alkalinitrilicum TaxID=427920 RepID=UPI000995962E|nr:phage tail spike protein [Alkalihalobacterium alkalinitrilicum]